MIKAHTMQFIEQLGGLTTFVEPDENNESQAYKLVPVSHWHQGNKFPHRVIMDLKAQSFNRTYVEGNEYYMLPIPTAKIPYVRIGTEQNGPEVFTRVSPTVKKYMKSEPKIKRAVKKIGK